MEPAIWTAMYAELDLDEAVRVLHGHGWAAFEASTEHLVQLERSTDGDAQIARTRAFLEGEGLSMPQAHALLQADVATVDPDVRRRDIERLCRHLEIARRLGVSNVVIHPGGHQEAATRVERDRTLALNVEAFRRLGDRAGEMELRIGLENLMRRGACTSYDMLDLLAAIDHPAIGIALDTSHAHAMRLDLDTSIRELGPHLVATHISDNDGSGDQHRTPGNGTVDWPPVIRALQDAGYDGLLNLEIPGARHATLQIRALKSRHAYHVAQWLVAPDLPLDRTSGGGTILGTRPGADERLRS